MAFDLVPSRFWSFPTLRSWEEEEDWISSPSTGVSISEDDKNVYIEAAVPGLNSEDIEVTFDKGIVWIKGEAKEEEKKKKYYRKSASSFSYRIAVPGEIDPNVEPEATYKNGVMTVTFAKSPKVAPKKITVKAK